ncbi:MAG TPA: hypothetical protein IAA83_10610 [Candidatus Avoscillospira avistercoris]|uniref:Uncharacterized protein n=1 Tax=Candidatus Avoscillospira avistercoris TaxID=2840707 RepID=A0A9D1JV08_9FIRM|nr:hypothetical protein [Candidatus Avoscillospira avistercoris]
MSMPNIPNLNPQISVNRDDAVNIILSSIGMEELSLAHILNAEAEKIQFALGTLETAGGQASSMTDILETNKLASKMVRNVIKKQMLLSMKMEDTVDLAEQTQPVTQPVTPPVTEPVVPPATEPVTPPVTEPIA